MKEPLIVTTESSRYFAELISKQLGIEIQEVKKKYFAGGELYHRFLNENRFAFLNREIVLVTSTNTDENIETLYRYGCALQKFGASKLIFVVPFLGYSTMERAVKPNEIISLKTFARKMSFIPQAPGGNYFLMMDLHVDTTPQFFEGNINPFQLYAEPVITKAIKEVIAPDFNNLVIASADLGRPYWVKTYANMFNAKMAFVDKTRFEDNTEVFAVIGSVEGKDVIIYDDMTRSGGTLINAGNAYLKEGAISVSAVLSHAAFDNIQVADLLDKSPLRTIITTNTHPMSQEPIIPFSDKIHALDVSSVFTDVISQILG